LSKTRFAHYPGLALSLAFQNRELGKRCGLVLNLSATQLGP
jgi:hypothetical protein